MALGHARYMDSCASAATIHRIKCLRANHTSAATAWLPSPVSAGYVTSIRDTSPSVSKKLTWEKQYIVRARNIKLLLPDSLVSHVAKLAVVVTLGHISTSTRTTYCSTGMASSSEQRANKRRRERPQKTLQRQQTPHTTPLSPSPKEPPPGSSRAVQK